MASRAAEDRRLFAWLYARFASTGERTGMADRRRNLLWRVEGTVLEIGAGTGLNLRHYGPGTEVIVTEPNRHMLRRARREADRSAARVRFEHAGAESLPVADASVDAVVSTLVLCSVADQQRALAESRRVLRPRGRLLFLEHVRSEDPRVASRQDRWTPLWRRIAGGCHPNRDTLAAVEAAGFEVVELDRYLERGPTIVRPHVTGVARLPG